MTVTKNAPRSAKAVKEIIRAYAERGEISANEAISRLRQINIRTDNTFEKDIAVIQRETRIPDRSNATRYAVHREATRIRNRLRRKTR